MNGFWRGIGVLLITVVGTVVGGWVLAWMTVNGYVPSKPTSHWDDFIQWAYSTITLWNVLAVLGAGIVLMIFFNAHRLPSLRLSVDIGPPSRRAESVPRHRSPPSDSHRGPFNGGGDELSHVSKMKLSAILDSLNPKDSGVSAASKSRLLDLAALNPDGSLKDEATSLNAVTANGRRVMLQFAKNSCTTLPMSTIAETLDWPMSQLKSVAGFLHKTQFIQYRSGPEGKLISLTPKGEQFVVRLHSEK